MPFKVIERDTSRKLVYELVLVVYNFRRITYRFRDTSCFDAENHIFPTQLYLTLNLKVISWNCGDEIWRHKSRIMWLPYGKEIVIVGRTMWTHAVHECDCDRQKDGQTDRFTMTKTELYKASRGKMPETEDRRLRPSDE